MLVQMLGILPQLCSGVMILSSSPPIETPIDCRQKPLLCSASSPVEAYNAAYGWYHKMGRFWSHRFNEPWVLANVVQFSQVLSSEQPQILLDIGFEVNAQNSRSGKEEPLDTMRQILAIQGLSGRADSIWSTYSNLIVTFTSDHEMKRPRSWNFLRRQSYLFLFALDLTHRVRVMSRKAHAMKPRVAGFFIKFYAQLCIVHDFML